MGDICNQWQIKQGAVMGEIATSRGSVGIEQVRPQHGEELPMLFLHGVGSDKSVWQPQLEAFGHFQHVIAADYPGYGESDFHPDATRDDFAFTMLALLDALGIERAHICGLSLGGVIAIAMAARAPDRIASLTLADTFAIHPEGQAIHDRSIAGAEMHGMGGLADARVDALLGSDPPPGLREEVVSTMAEIPLAAYRLGARAVWLADQRARAAAIDAPTLILCGEEDQITPPALSEDLAGLIPHARLAFIAGAGHLANAERPTTFNARLREHLQFVD